MLVPLILNTFFSQAVNPADQLKVHISGVIAHGQNEFLTFLDIGQFPHDFNLTNNIILPDPLQNKQYDGNYYLIL